MVIIDQVFPDEEKKNFFRKIVKFVFQEKSRKSSQFFSKPSVEVLFQDVTTFRVPSENGGSV